MHQKTTELHHRVPRRLLTAHDRLRSHQQLDGDALQAWFDYEELLFEFGLAPDISRKELEERIEDSVVEISYEEHRYSIHGKDWSRWGRMGGLKVLELYGPVYFAYLARRRWRKVSTGELSRVRERLRLSREAMA